MSLAELEYDHTIHERERAGDDKLYVRFYTDILFDADASKATGMKKFRDAEMIQIMVPGDKRNIVVREVREDDRERFAKHYAMFREGAEEQITGYPLKEWTGCTRAMAEEFKYLGFRTVEQIAAANDSILSKYPGMREIQTRAKNWLAAQEGAAPLEKMQSALEERDKAIAAQQAQIQEMVKALAELKAAKK
jgi:two-component sensor histidine kinase